jgi:hypothetical protein
MVAPSLLLSVGSHVSVKVHPVVLLQICDSYIRRGEKQDRVIGTLLGTVADGAVNISRCFVVPHTESLDQVRWCGCGCGCVLQQQQQQHLCGPAAAAHAATAITRGAAAATSAVAAVESRCGWPFRSCTQIRPGPSCPCTLS